jgi:hypothetical protein
MLALPGVLSQTSTGPDPYIGATSVKHQEVMLDTEELGFGKRVVLSEPTRRIRLEAFMAGIKGLFTVSSRPLHV